MRRVSRSAGQQVSGGARKDVVSFDLARVNAGLAGTVFAGKLQHFASVDSTQTLALQAASAGAQAGIVFVADEQTAGRGRGGHTWHSEPGSGLYCTMLLRPGLQATDALRISLAAGLAAQHAIRDTTGITCDLRWPNDLVTRGQGEAPGGSRKLGGILTETAMQPDGALRYAVVGIGINVNQPAMPPELQSVASSLRMLCGHVTPREDLLLALLRAFEGELATAESDGAALLSRFTAASSWVLGRRVRVAEGEGYTGTTAGLNEAGLLQVRLDDGETRTVLHGGVRELDNPQVTPQPATNP